jgi:hypothetical protein
MIFSSSCKSTQTIDSDVTDIMAALQPPLPDPPVIEQVIFEDKENGLWLSYNDYRALERNIIALREYAARLEIIIWFYREEK